jgi:hypothetical protein
MPRVEALRAAIVLLLVLPASPASAAESPLGREFVATVRPFLEAHCVQCHGRDKPKAQLDLSAYTTLDSVVRGQRQWETVLEMLEGGEMPPQEAEAQPSAPLRAQVVRWLQALRREEARKNAGDPGPVLARRLSNAEYDYTVRDLTGADIRPTREFPVDPANEAGFDNSGESLAMSPALLKKYLEAGRAVAEHLVLTPTGLVFAPHPVVTATDRDKYAVLRIVDFYERQPTDLAAYFLAAWRHHHKAALGQSDVTLAARAARDEVSAKYLRTVWSALVETPEEVGPLATVQRRWRALPAPAGGAEPPGLRARAEELRDFVVALREKLSPRWKNLQLKAVATGAQPFVLWKNKQYATHRTSFDPRELYDPEDPAVKRDLEGRRQARAAVTAWRGSLTGLTGQSPLWGALAVQLDGVHRRLEQYATLDPDLAAPAAERARYEAAFARFCRVFPDAFYVSERGRMHLDRPKERQDKGRFLSAGFHNMHGYFRDDLPLYQLILDEAGQRALDGLWRELDFVTDSPRRQHADFIFYERAEPPRTIKGPEFDFVRSEDRSSASRATIERLARAYVAHARESLKKDGGDAHSIGVLEDYFRTVNASIRRVERERVVAEPRHLDDLVAFAQRAYRRPLARAEREGILAFYRGLRRKDRLGHEEAVRDTLVSVLVSPHFLYRVDLVSGKGAQPLPDYALASRLSYFLWSSMPDAELLARAAAGDLHRPEVIAAQARRMLRDERARALAVEFGGNWLDFRRFEEHNGVDRERFPSFDGELRQAMFEEPVRFFEDVVKEDRSVLDFLHARHTFVNAPLARHYGMPVPAGGGWVRVDDARPYQRGGILPMAVFLTKNAPGLRTSPVKRGYWVVRRALGERIPAPPAQVPDLPNDERKLGNLTLREVLAKHRENAACAGCHARFDSFGLAFEGFGPIGERRTKDLGGRPVDTRATFPGGKEGTGLEGLREYLRAHRQDDFVENLCRKLSSFALGRTLMLFDDPAIEQMKARLAADGFRFGSLVESIVTSPQFLTKRGREPLALR